MMPPVFQIIDRHSFRAFLGLTAADGVPDGQTIAGADEPFHAMGILRMANADNRSGGCIHLEDKGFVGERVGKEAIRSLSSLFHTSRHRGHLFDYQVWAALVSPPVTSVSGSSPAVRRSDCAPATAAGSRRIMGRGES